MYDTLKAKYSENRIVVIGQSIGSGAASFLGAHNQPKMVILQAPYYSIADWIHQLVPALKIVNNLPVSSDTRRC
jgi:esterase/lipase